MRLFPVLSVAALLMAAPALHAQNDAQVAEAVKQEIMKKTSVTATPIADPNLTTCFAAVFYKVTIEQDAGGGATSSNHAVYMKTAKGLVEASKPCTDEAVPALLNVINPKVRLIDDATGTAMLNALNAIYKEDGHFGKKFEPVLAHTGTTWNFILGEFTGKKFSGFVMTTNAQGQITKVDYSLNITK